MTSLETDSRRKKKLYISTCLILFLAFLTRHPLFSFCTEPHKVAGPSSTDMVVTELGTQVSSILLPHYCGFKYSGPRYSIHFTANMMAK